MKRRAFISPDDTPLAPKLGKIAIAVGIFALIYLVLFIVAANFCLYFFGLFRPVTSEMWWAGLAGNSHDVVVITR
jgi:hypothetical protein